MQWFGALVSSMVSGSEMQKKQTRISAPQQEKESVACDRRESVMFEIKDRVFLVMTGINDNTRKHGQDRV